MTISSNQSIEIKKMIKQIYPEIIKIRQNIHAHPELSNCEYKTADLIESILASWGYTLNPRILDTGICVILDSQKPGKTVALRADMDALPINETSKVDYVSEAEGVMHACGHDGHIATLLTAAYVLRKMEFSGKIKFIFQPAEELGTGANSMISQGVLQNPKVDAIFGYHNLPGYPKNKILLKPNCIMAGIARFKITVNGTGGHSSAPDKTIDPIYIGSSIVQALQSIVSRSLEPFDPTVISVTQFHCGSADNVISDQAILSGSVRFTDNNKIDFVKSKMSNMIKNIAKSLGGEAEVEFIQIVPATINSEKETNLVRQTAEELFGSKHIEDLKNNIMATEDFSYYLNKIPGCFILVGTGESKQYLHHPEYIFEDEIIPIVSELLVATALNFLRDEL